jgi:hypothetical protein
MAREGQRPQNFPLARAPELHGLLTGFSALLGGDRAALEREFEVGVELGREGWTLVLTPRAERTRKRIGRIAIEGRGRRAALLRVDGSGENASVMLLGAAAEAPLPEPLERAALERRCADGDDVTAGARALGVLAWIALVAALGFVGAGAARVGTDLRLFMPSPETPAQRLLLEEIGEGPGARLLLVALEGAEPESLAASSRALDRAGAAIRCSATSPNGERAWTTSPTRCSPTATCCRRHWTRRRSTRPPARRARNSACRTSPRPWARCSSPGCRAIRRSRRSRGTGLAAVRQPERAYDVCSIAPAGGRCWSRRRAHRASDPDAQRQALDALDATSPPPAPAPRSAWS